MLFKLKDAMKLPAREDAFHNSFFDQDNAEGYHPVFESSLVTDNAAEVVKDTNFEAIDLENLDMGTPPEFDLAVNLPFHSSSIQ